MEVANGACALVSDRHVQTPSALQVRTEKALRDEENVTVPWVVGRAGAVCTPDSERSFMQQYGGW